MKQNYENAFTNIQSIVQHFRYRYQWLWAKFRQRHVNLPKLRRGKV